ncbi:hypothetical protein [Pyxidicoccus xibeiensis]|uniref:hypothetical protein n=1 Tax=Pyxidicoccus xibeiensis TaxID=2906759 RepID=UPI0020A7CDAB|nr:hypothetical protein [Pyxidicoccus xibeiensis]MCP3136221.1 hypothetical protein [Pyxidicoccus xibeiensis]
MRSRELWETRPATPEDVLELLRDDLRHRAGWDPEVDGGATLTFDTPVAEWMDAGDLLTSWKALAPALNDWLGVDFAPEAWRGLLSPRSRPLGHLCAHVASHLRIPVLPALRVAGTACATAGAFLTLRTALVRAGLPVAGARPSARLPLDTWAQLDTFTRAVTRLAPGVLPAAKVRVDRTRSRCGWAFMGGLALTLLGGSSLGGAPGVLGGLLLAGGLLGLWLTRNAPPEDIRFEGLSTLGDVARALAARRVVESPPC